MHARMAYVEVGQKIGVVHMKVELSESQVAGCAKLFLQSFLLPP